MLATPGPLPNGPDWLYEVKWDGLRVLVDVDTEDETTTMRITTTTGRDVTADFPELASMVDLAPDVLLDGEIILLEHGVPSFAALTERLHGPVPAALALARPVTFMASDVLRLYGVDLTERTLDARRATLLRLDSELVSTLAVSPAYTDGRALLDATEQQGMAGVVAKRRDGLYVPGARSADWVVTAHRQVQECVVGGWRPERGNPGRITSLLVGVPDPGGRGLTYVGSVGAGLTSQVAQHLLSRRLVPGVAPPFAQSPFAQSPFVQPLPRVDATGARWCAPTTVVEVSHRGWTADGRLRQAVYRGVRDDMDSAAVVRHS
jgi:bifunctional non-homologous end joining protein LigD